MITDTELKSDLERIPHFTAATVAIQDGRNWGFRGGKPECRLTDPALRADWFYGFRSARAEVALDEDTEWDQD